VKIPFTLEQLHLTKALPVIAEHLFALCPVQKGLEHVAGHTRSSAGFSKHSCETALERKDTNFLEQLVAADGTNTFTPDMDLGKAAQRCRDISASALMHKNDPICKEYQALVDEFFEGFCAYIEERIHRLRATMESSDISLATQLEYSLGYQRKQDEMRTVLATSFGSKTSSQNFVETTPPQCNCVGIFFAIHTYSSVSVNLPKNLTYNGMLDNLGRGMMGAFSAVSSECSIKRNTSDSSNGGGSTCSSSSSTSSSSTSSSSTSSSSTSSSSSSDVRQMVEQGRPGNSFREVLTLFVRGDRNAALAPHAIMIALAYVNESGVVKGVFPPQRGTDVQGRMHPSIAIDLDAPGPQQQVKQKQQQARFAERYMKASKRIDTLYALSQQTRAMVKPLSVAHYDAEVRKWRYNPDTGCPMCPVNIHLKRITCSCESECCGGGLCPGTTVQRSYCNCDRPDCGGGLCPVMKVQRYTCNCDRPDCGSGLCPVMKVQRSVCNCGGEDCGSGLCPGSKDKRSVCNCGGPHCGGSFCLHGKVRSLCGSCGGGFMYVMIFCVPIFLLF
jgi:hypothetical protein